MDVRKHLDQTFTSRDVHTSTVVRSRAGMMPAMFCVGFLHRSAPTNPATRLKRHFNDSRSPPHAKAGLCSIHSSCGVPERAECICGFLMYCNLEANCQGLRADNGLVLEARPSASPRKSPLRRTTHRLLLCDEASDTRIMSLPAHRMAKHRAKISSRCAAAASASTGQEQGRRRRPQYAGKLRYIVLSQCW